MPMSHLYFHPILIALVLGALLCACTPSGEGCGNAVSNSSFEENDGHAPLHWKQRIWRGQARFAYVPEGRQAGSPCVLIASRKGADAAWQTNVPVKLYSRYRLSGWIRTENVTTQTGKAPAPTGKGALLNVHGIEGAFTRPIVGTRDWTRVEVEIETQKMDAVTINCLLGGWGYAAGRVWFDDIRLECIETRALNPSARVETNAVGAEISPYIYGQFIEHLGRCIYGGIWAEMLEDRKFFYAVDEEESPWSSLNAKRRAVMSGSFAYAGKQAVELALDPDQGPSGIVQGGLGLIAGKSYEGRIVLSGDPAAAPVEIRLVWDEGARTTDSVRVDTISESYATVPWTFTAGATVDDARLEIEGLGRGRLRIGAVSLMPGDNVDGFRKDTLELMKQLNAPVYRWPGGNFVSGYDWKDGIGDRDRRPPRKNPAWTGVEHNDVGLHEYLDLCDKLGTEPFITVNTGLGDVTMAADQVEYVNGSVDSAMGRLRAANGHPEPYGVKWWAIGNEMYGAWQLGHMPLEEYIQKHIRVAQAMRDKDPSIKRIAVGSVGPWSEQMLTLCGDAMELISEHFYCQERPGLSAHVAQIPQRIREIASAHREYRKEIPGLEAKNIRIAMDEWNYWYGPYLYGELGTRYFLKDALGVAAGLHEFFRNSDIIYMANYAQTVNVIGCIKTSKTAAAFATTGLALKLYRRHFGTIPVMIGGTPEPLDVMAAWTADRRALTVGVVNPTSDRIPLALEFDGAKFSGTGTLWTITGPDAMAFNEPGEPPAVRIEETRAVRWDDRFDAPPISISLLEFEKER